MLLPPPWIQNITGRALSPEGTSLGENGGAQMFRYRQSSLPTGAFDFGERPAPDSSEGNCTHMLPIASALRGVVHGCGGRGAFQRSSPTGGAA